MKTENRHRLAAVFIVLAMLLSLVPFEAFVRTTARAAAGGTYTLVADDLYNSLKATEDPGETGTITKAAGNEKAGTDDYFTLYYKQGSKIDASSKKFDDGSNFSYRINLQGAVDLTKPEKVISFKTEEAATVKVWWVKGKDSTDTRELAIYDSTGKELKSTSGTENVATITPFDVDEGGTYYIGGKNNGINIFKIEVVEETSGPAVASEEFVFESKTLTAAGKGECPADPVPAGTNNFFTLHYSSSSAINSSNKTWDDGYASGQRVNFGGTASTSSNSIEFTTTNAATVKVWWAAGDNGRQITILNSTGTAVETTKDESKKDQPYISTFKLSEAGKYYLGNSVGNNYIFKVMVRYGKVVPNEWGTVAAPTITGATADNEAGTITVNVSAAVGEKDGDKVTVYMYDESGKEVGKGASAKESANHAVVLKPTASGSYTFKAALSRDGETDKVSAVSDAVPFTLPLGKPSITSATNKGNGSVELEWTAVPEAEGYNIYVGEDIAGVSTTTSYTADGLTVGTKVSFRVEATRGLSDKGPKSDAREVTIVAEAQSKWSSIYYGTSTSSSKNKVTGNINEGSVTLSAMGGAGKIIPGSSEGVTYYYTAIPANKNFTLRANIHLDRWTYDNGQEGFGLIALDRLPEHPNNTEVHWSNQYLLGVQKVEYRWDSETNDFADYSNADYPKYSMSLGVGALVKSGITPANLATVKAGTDTTLVGQVAPKEQIPLEHSATDLPAGNYNIVGGLTAPIPDAKGITSIDTLQNFELEIRKNNTGYFLTYYGPNGAVTKKFYEPGELSVLDTENVYVGFFAARNAEITINKNDFSLTIIDPEDDDPAEERPITYVTPNLSITSASVSNTDNYNLMLNSNVNGSVTISVNDIPVETDVPITAGKMLTQKIKLPYSGTHSITAVLTPAPDEGQNFPAYTQIANTDPVTASVNVSYTTKYSKLKNLYVAPNGSYSGDGSSDNPLDIYTAVKVAQPGQTIVVMEGTYNLASPLRIERGMDGTADEPIKMIADPEAETRPVFDFTDSSEGIRLGGNYWHLYGFDVTNSNGTGMRVCGNYNTVERLDLYANGNTGLQISAYRDSNDPVELRPNYNTILNCTSFNNADPTGQDADGFAAKLTVGEGNVFDGCAAYNNTDDGWDLYARVSSGAIGAVTIKNCLAYNNGHNIAGTIRGNGNGFKLGGENLPAGHTIINSFAFDNDADGITSNSCPDVKVINCTSYNNKKKDLNLYTNNSSNTTNFMVQGVVVGSSGYDIKKNTTDTSQVAADAVKTATDADFENTTFEGLSRKDSGAIDLGDFLKLKDSSAGGADLDKEVDVSGSGSGSTTLTPTTPSSPADPDNKPGDSDSKPADDKSTEFKDNDNNTDITVTAPNGAFDNAEDVKFNANPVPEETNDEEFTFDLFFTNKDGSKVQPKVSVTVKIPVPEALKNKDIFVYHVESDGKYTEIDCKVENGMVVFTATSFSKYIITSKKLAAANNDSNTSADNSSGTSSGSANPSTSTTIPMTRFVIFAASAAALCVFRRKRG